MAIDHGHGAGAGSNPGVAYDKTDLGARGILIFFLVLAVFAIAMHLVVLGLYAGMTRIAEKREPETSPLAPQTSAPRTEILTNTANVNVEQFPQPRLSTHLSQHGMGPRSQPGEMTKLLLQEAAVLTAKSWQDADGNIHLPIDQAMKSVLTRLPARAGGEAPPNHPGAAREYSYPAGPHAATQVESAPGQSNVQSEAGDSTAGE
jgi:hypothetical protein